jgi:hypothetical protein
LSFLTYTERGSSRTEISGDGEGMSATTAAKLLVTVGEFPSSPWISEGEELNWGNGGFGFGR